MEQHFVITVYLEGASCPMRRRTTVQSPSGARAESALVVEWDPARFNTTYTAAAVDWDRKGDWTRVKTFRIILKPLLIVSVDLEVIVIDNNPKKMYLVNPNLAHPEPTMASAIIALWTL